MLWTRRNSNAKMRWDSTYVRRPYSSSAGATRTAQDIRNTFAMPVTPEGNHASARSGFAWAWERKWRKSSSLSISPSLAKTYFSLEANSQPEVHLELNYSIIVHAPPSPAFTLPQSVVEETADTIGSGGPSFGPTTRVMPAGTQSRIAQQGFNPLTSR